MVYRGYTPVSDPEKRMAVAISATGSSNPDKKRTAQHYFFLRLGRGAEKAQKAQAPAFRGDVVLDVFGGFGTIWWFPKIGIPINHQFS